HVVLARRYSERAAEIGAEEVGHQENDAALGDGALQVLERGGDVGAATLRREVEHLAHDAQDVVLPLAGPEELLDPVAEGDETDPVVVLDRREGQNRADLRLDLALELP